MNDADMCGQHDKPILDHTVREMRDCHPAKDLNLPFEVGPEQQQFLDTFKASGLVVLAGVMDTSLGKFPVLVFRFVMGDGVTFFPDMTLVLDEVAMRNTAALVNQSVSAAIKQAKA